MSKPKNRPKPDLQPSDLWIVRACLAIALGISLFLAWSSFQGGGIPGCGPESACDKVLSSRWAYALGLPVSVFAIPVYVGLMALVRARDVNWRLVTPLAALVLASALWFIGLQAFALRAFCKFCMTAHAAGVVGALILLRNSTLPFPKILTSSAMAAAAASALILAQWFSPERGPARLVSSVPFVPAPSVPAEAATNITSAPVIMRIVEGEFSLDLSKVPVAGSVNAPKKVAKLFDYTCHHCRDLHHLLAEFRLKHSNELAVISLPMPLDSQCNPLVRTTPSAHVNSCQYASFGLAVFQANPAKFEEFTDYIYATPRPPELKLARQHAAELVGAAQFEQALTHPAVAAQIRTDIEIYKAAYRKSKSGQMPQMHFEHGGASIGAVETREALEKVMAENLGFPPPAK